MNSNPVIDNIKVEMIEAILSKMDELHMTQKELASLLQVSAPRISNMVHMQLNKFSVDTLLGWLYILQIATHIRFNGE